MSDEQTQTTDAKQMLKNLRERAKAANAAKQDAAPAGEELTPEQAAPVVETSADEDQPVSSDQVPSEVFDGQENGDASASVTGIEADEDPVAKRMRLRVEKLRQQLQANESKLEQRAQKQAAKAERKSATTTKEPKEPKVKASKAKFEPETVADMFPRHPAVQAIWSKVEAQVASAADGNVVLSINQLGRDLNLTRQTAKRAVHALVKAGILVDQTPNLNAAHTYSINIPTETFEANKAKNAESGAVRPTAAEIAAEGGSDEAAEDEAAEA